MPEYIVVARAQSGVRFGKDDALVCRQIPTPVGRVDMVIKTRFAPMAGFSKPLPMGLMAEVRGIAPSLDEAVEQFSKAAQSLCPVLALAGNSPIEDMAPEIGYDFSPGITEREYFQQFLPEERFLLVERRRLSSDLLGRMLNALIHHPSSDRLHRAFAQYYQALRNWELGQETLALAHLWMGVEALTPIVLHRTLSGLGLDRASLASSWSVEARHLDSEVRRRLIFENDEESYKRARSTSDGFEHGFLNFVEINEHSAAVRLKVASHLRAAIIAQLGLDASDVKVLTSCPFNKPGHLHIAKYVRGMLIAPSEHLAADGQAHPFLEWRTTFQEVPSESPNEVNFTFKDHFTTRLAEGVSFKLRGIKIWGGQEGLLKRNQATPEPDPEV